MGTVSIRHHHSAPGAWETRATCPQLSEPTTGSTEEPGPTFCPLVQLSHELEVPLKLTRKVLDA